MRNLPDGRVEVVACGEKAALKRLEQWLWQGPRHARVENVTVQESATEPHAGFSVRG
ncbi:MAG: acylphosphatase [Gammaproteobacteria bacterium]|nr:acylphosphatase [Gammaproteobacteria bacterium]